MEQEYKTYYSITTCRFTLRCNHPDWLVRTQEFYNLIFSFYYDLFLKLEAAGTRLSELSGQKALRELEVLTIVGRKKEPVPYPIPWEKAPLYFRRAAANRAVAAGHAKLGSNVGRGGKEDGQGGRECVTYYKGMYRNFTERSVELKVWNGSRWEFLHCRLYGNTLPVGCKCLSPSVQFQDKYIFLNVPVRNQVSDGRRARERYRQGARICSIQFGSGDVFAVGVLLEGSGEEIGFRFFRGGDEYAHRCRQIAMRIEKAVEARKPKNTMESEKAENPEGNGHPEGVGKMPGHAGPEATPAAGGGYEPYDKKRWMKLKHINKYYSNLISRQVINYMVENQVEMIVLPAYKKGYSQYVQISSGNWSSVHLNTKIRELLFQKAWRAGILVLETVPAGCGSVCAQCGASIRKKRKEYMCKNGHHGNRYLNTARNLGRCFLESMAGNER